MHTDEANCESRRVRFRKLRIAWSLVWGLACLLLIVLWVRSYWRMDMIDGHAPALRDLSVFSVQGRIIVSRRGTDDLFDWELQSCSVQENLELIAMDVIPVRYFEVDPSNGSVLVTVPDWFATLLITAIATVPWLRHRFSLRTLLIATTLAQLPQQFAKLPRAVIFLDFFCA